MSSDNTAAHNDLPGSSEPQESHANALPVSEGHLPRQSQNVVPANWQPRQQSSGEGGPISAVIVATQDPDVPTLFPNQASPSKTSKPSSPSSERDSSEFEIELFLTPPRSSCAEQQQQRKRQREEPDDGAGHEEPPLSKRRTTGNDQQNSNDGLSPSRDVCATDSKGTGERRVPEKDIAELAARAWRVLQEAKELNDEMEEFLMEVGDFLTPPQNPENQHGRDDHSHVTEEAESEEEQQEEQEILAIWDAELNEEDLLFDADEDWEDMEEVEGNVHVEDANEECEV
eukprot:m51a1_g12131 hypothetical protein (286) ;mRNA; r:2948-4112